MKEILIHFFKTYKKPQILMILGAILVVAADLYYKYMVKILIDDILIKEQFNEFYLWCLYAGALLTASFILTYLYYYVLIKRYTIQVVFDLRKLMLKNVLNRSFLNFIKIDQSYYINKVMEDAERLGEYVNVFWYVLFSNTLRFVITLGVLFWLSPELTISILVIIPLYYIFIKWSRRFLEEMTKAERKESDGFYQLLTQTLAGFKLIKVFQKEKFFQNKVKEQSDLWQGKKVKLFLVQEMFSMAGSYISSLAPLVTLAFGTYLIMQGNLSIGKLMTFYIIMGDLYIPLDELFRFLTNKNAIKPIFERNLDLLSLKSSSRSKVKNSCQQEGLMVKASQLNFSFGDKKIISDFNCELDKGKLYCLTGRNGSGKSTLFNLIADLYPTKKDELQVSQSVAIAEQTPILFNGTLDENLWFDHPDKMNEHLMNLFNIEELKEKTENQYDGNNLSGGEKQRVSLVRALSSEKDIILLDEPTTYLDNHYIQALNQSIEELIKQGKTILCISHDPDFISRATETLQLPSQQSI